MKYGSIDDTQIPEHQMGNRQPYKAGIGTDHAIGQHTFLVCRIPAEQQQQELAQILADTLELDYDTVLGKIKRTDTQYQIIAQKVDKDTENALYKKLETAGCDNAVYPEPDTKR